VVFGVTAVIMPGTVLGDGAILGAIAAADVGQELNGGTLYMGVPATPTTKHETGVRPCSFERILRNDLTA
jgi:carbonic anhydrase/acetyltransferase-like protein (isoleucine patch superfamily)